MDSDPGRTVHVGIRTLFLFPGFQQSLVLGLEPPEEYRYWISLQVRQWVHVPASVLLTHGQISEIFHVNVDCGS